MILKTACGVNVQRETVALHTNALSVARRHDIKSDWFVQKISRNEDTWAMQVDNNLEETATSTTPNEQEQVRYFPSVFTKLTFSTFARLLHKVPDQMNWRTWQLGNHRYGTHPLAFQI
jgi:hypothetical protein